MARNNSRAQSSQQQSQGYMLRIVLIVVFSLFVIGVLYECFKPDPLEESENLVYVQLPTEPAKISKIRMWFDNSASMNGYLSSTANHDQGFLYTLSRVLNLTEDLEVTLSASHETLTANAFKDSILKHNLCFKGSAQIKTDIENMINSFDLKGKQKDNHVAVYVTDGIMSRDYAAVAKTPDINKNERELMKGEIKKLFKKVYEADLAVSVYRFLDEFDGKYSYYDDSNTNIVCRRPWFVIVIGKPGQVASFKQEVGKWKMDATNHCNLKHELHFIDKKPMGGLLSLGEGITSQKSSFRDSVYVNFQFDKRNLKHNFNDKLTLQIKDDFLRNANLPETVNFDKQKKSPYELMAGNMKVEVNGSGQTSKDNPVKYLSTSRVFQFYISGNALTMRTTEIRISMPAHQPSWWNDLSTDDDKKETDFPKKTFNLKYLMQGIYEGMHGDELQNIYEWKITLDNKQK